MKDKLVLICWITGLLLFISVFWIIIQPVQTYYLMRTVNNIFINNDDSRRVSDYIPHKSGKADLMGYWYKLFNSQDNIFVFTIFQDGILVPLGAVVSSGFVKEIIPLSAHAEQVYSKMPQSILQIYIRRIEEAVPGMEGIR
ncbi:MAG: hypothetical protein LBU88_02535 [Treponema sp.]|jgi:hypothetical protein|nr:hypothetical protein [Treponema sp.]